MAEGDSDEMVRDAFRGAEEWLDKSAWIDFMGKIAKPNYKYRITVYNNVSLVVVFYMEDMRGEEDKYLVVDTVYSGDYKHLTDITGVFCDYAEDLAIHLQSELEAMK